MVQPNMQLFPYEKGIYTYPSDMCTPGCLNNLNVQIVSDRLNEFPGRYAVINMNEPSCAIVEVTLG